MYEEQNKVSDIIRIKCVYLLFKYLFLPWIVNHSNSDDETLTAYIHLCSDGHLSHKLHVTTDLV